MATETAAPWLANGWGIVPTFHPEPAFAGLWLDRDGDCRGVLADWLEEHADPYAAVLREEVR